MDLTRLTSYRPGRSIRWVVNPTSLTLTDGTHVHRLEYPDAAIWDLLTRGYAFKKIVSMMTHIASLDETAAESLVRARLSAWMATGLVERA